MRPPVVLLDACTLYPAALRDVLMRMALHRLIQARLSLVRPPATTEEYLETLRIQDLTRTCELLHPFLSEL